jgi:anti-sigma regulatory factor (Ser/Thr protein kinase)
MPVSEIFHTMTLKGVDDDRVLAEINRKLYQLLPADRFMAAWLISISHTGTTLRWWNGGMPSGWIQTRYGLNELGSHSLPLGILHPLPEQEHANYLRVEPMDRLLLMSDGLLETATLPDGKMFEDVGFRSVLEEWRHGEPVMEPLVAALDDLRSGEPLDDITIVEIPLGSSVYSGPQVPKAALYQSGWQWAIELADARLDTLPSLEDLLGPLGLLEGLHNHVGALQTIVTELYTNALEHGVLKLESAMKSTPDGFELYYRERERRLAIPTFGWIKLSLAYHPGAGREGQIRILVRDSGAGFDDQNTAQTDASQPWGRGLKLVEDLCESVSYRHCGSEVEVIYAW